VIHTAGDVEIESCERFDAEGQQTAFRVGAKIKDGKSRWFVVLKSTGTVAELFNAAKDLGDGVLVASSEAGAIALLHKGYDDRIETEGIEIFNPLQSGRMAAAKTQEVFESFAKAAKIGNMRLRESKGIESMPFEDVMKEIGSKKPLELIAWLANASQAVKDDTASKLQASAIKTEKYVNKYIKAAEQSHACMYDAKGGDYTYPSSFLDSVKELTCIGYDDRSESISRVALDKALHSIIYLNKAFFVVGKSGAGKTNLVEAIAQMLSLRHQFEKYYSGKAIDPLGTLTKSGAMQQIGCLILHDFMLKTMKNVDIDHEGIKSLVGVGEVGKIPARWHQIILPKWLPRLFAINSGKDGDFAHWFKKQKNAQSLVNLCDEKASEIANMSEDDIAIARRSIIIKVPDYLFEKKEDAEETGADWEYYKSAMARAQGSLAS